MNHEDCPKCLGIGETMEANTNKKGFHYEKCSLCNGNKTVPTELANDFILSLNEDIIDNFEDE